ncbi:hypothetical protein EJ05DRAFT_481207, partial [Pseudovirgaria hyperparasitica]
MSTRLTNPRARPVLQLFMDAKSTKTLNTKHTFPWIIDAPRLTRSQYAVTIATLLLPYRGRAVVEITLIGGQEEVSLTENPDQANHTGLPPDQARLDNRDAAHVDSGLPVDNASVGNISERVWSMSENSVLKFWDCEPDPPERTPAQRDVFSNPGGGIRI